eukprot:scaffold268_cov236-Pinguiococcus_pyrenoidosus.AAC.3
MPCERCARRSPVSETALESPPCRTAVSCRMPAHRALCMQLRVPVECEARRGARKRQLGKLRKRARVWRRGAQEISYLETHRARRVPHLVSRSCCQMPDGRCWGGVQRRAAVLDGVHWGG